MSFNFQRLNKATTPASDSAAINQFVDIYRRAIDAIDPDLTSIQSGDWAAMVGDLKGFENFLRQIFNPLRAALAAGGIQQEAPLSRAVNATMRFDITDPRAIAYAQDRVGELIKQVTDEVKQTVRDVVARAYREGRTIDQIAAELRNSIGLHDRWARAVENYQRRQFEQLVKTMPYDTAMQKAAALAEKYRARLIRKRAMTIARTETAQASMYGRYLSWLQAADSGLIDPYTTGKRWLATRPCDRCKVLNSKPAIGMLEPFSNGKLMPPDHPNCKCRAVLIPNWKASNRPVVVQKAYQRKYATREEAARAAANARWGNRTPDVPTVADKPTKKVDPVKDAYRAFQAEAKKKKNLEKILELEKVWLNAVRDNAPPKGEWRECGSVKEARAQFYGQGWTTETHFGKLSVPMVNEVCKTWNELGTKYPEVAAYVNDLGGHSGLRDAGKLPVNKFSALGTAFYGPRTIALNDSYSRDEYEEFAQRAVETGFHPPRTGSKGDGVRSVLVHEFGHMVARQTGLRQTEAAIEEVRLSRPAGLREKSQKEFVKTNLSDYGTKNSDEAFAEAFTEYHMSPNPRPLATAIVEQSFDAIGKTQWKRDTVAKAYKRKYATREEAARAAANARWGGKKADAPGSTRTAAAEWTDLPTTDAIEQEWQRRFPNIKVNLVGIKPDVANEAAASFVENAALFPEVAERIGTIQGSYMSVAASARQPIFNPATGKYQSGIIRISSVGTKEEFDDAVKRGQESGLFVAGSYDPSRIVNGRPMTGVRSVMTHEFGHHVDYWLRSMTDGRSPSPAGAKDHDKFLQSTKLKIKREFQKTLVPGAKADVNFAIGKTISRYATTNNRELFAESFTEFYSSPNPRPAARTIIESAFANVGLPVPSASIEKAYKRKYATREEAARAAANARWGNRATETGTADTSAVKIEPWVEQQSVKDVNREFNKRWGDRTILDLTGVSPDSANGIADGLNELLTLYPDTELHFVGTENAFKNAFSGRGVGLPPSLSQEKRKELVDLAVGFGLPPMGEGVAGSYITTVQGIRINAKLMDFDNQARFAVSSVQSEENRFYTSTGLIGEGKLSTVVKEAAKRTLVHEFAHAIDFTGSQAFGRRPVSKRIEGLGDPVSRAMAGTPITPESRKKFVGYYVGEYASTNAAELFAEVFTEYHLNPKPRKLSVDQAEYVMQRGNKTLAQPSMSNGIEKAYQRKYATRREAAQAAARARWGNRTPKQDGASQVYSADFEPWEKQQGHPEIEAEMRRRFPHLGWSFREGSVAIANEVAASFVDLADQYPEVAKRIKNVGDEIGMRDLERASSGYPMRAALGDAANGLDQAATPWIRMNTGYSELGFDDVAAEGQKSGFKSQGIFSVDRTLNGRKLSGVRATITHEFGHHVDYWLTDQFKKKYRMQGYEAELQRNEAKQAVGRAFGGTEKGLSKYATRNSRELFAEAFTEYQLSDSPRGMSRRVIEDAFTAVDLPVPVAPATVITKAYQRKYGSREEAARAAANARWGNSATETTAEDDSYRMSHQPSEVGPRAHDLTEDGGEGEYLTDDVYAHPERYSGAGTTVIRETMAQLKQAKGNPDAIVTIHRWAPEGNAIESGNWVSLSKTYAEQHGESNSSGKAGSVISLDVPAKTIRFAGDDLAEFGYWPSSADAIAKAYKRKYGSRTEAARAAANARWGNRAKVEDTASDSGSVDRYVPSEKLLDAIDKSAAVDNPPVSFEEFGKTPEGKEIIAEYAEKVFANEDYPEQVADYAVSILYRNARRQAEERVFYAEESPGIIESNQRKLKEILATQPVTINLTSDDLEKVFKDGRFKSQFETGDSEGAYNPEKRNETEAIVFGYSTRTTSPEKRPIYGSIPEFGAAALARPGETGTWLYGDTRVVLKDSVRSRTTFTAGDSLGMGWNPSSVENPRLDGASLTTKKPYVGYIEAQIHGGVKVSDIKELVIKDPRKAYPNSPAPWNTVAAKLGKQFGIPVRVLDLDGTVTTLGESA